MSNLKGPITVMVAIYDNEVDAAVALATLQRMESDGEIELHDAAVLVKEGSSDKLKIKETAEFTPKKGALEGAVAGGIIGVIFPPAILVMGALGAAAGAALGHFTDQGFKNDLLKEMGEEVPSRGSALVVVVEERWVEELTKYVARSGTIRTYPLDDEASARLLGRE